VLQVERHHHKGNDTIVALCKTSKELYNKCNFLMRQAWFGDAPLPNINDLVAAVKDEDCFKHLHNTKTAKQTIRKVLTDWSNFKAALRVWKADPSFRKPKPPYYKKHMAQVIFYKETILGGQSGKDLSMIVPTNHCFSVPSTRKFKQVVITPKTFGFVIDVQYEVPDQPKTENTGVCCVDIGLNNLCAITSDQHSPVLVNGRIVKSINQWFNKRPTKKASRKRYWRLENYFHHVSKLIVAKCLKHGIGTIIIGKNDGWKCEMNLGKKTNQNFQYVPFWNLMQKIRYKAELAGIEVAFTEESYTSKASFLDRDPLPVYEKGVSHSFSGTRIGRGRYRASDGRILNADVNGSANIGRKVIRNEDVILRLDRSVAATPVRVNPLKVCCV
jgi:IS605 OrfB family transposase